MKTDTGNLNHGTRVCRTCNESKDINEYYWTAHKKGRTRECKSCKADKVRERNKNKVIDPEKQYAYHIRKTYGISIDTFYKLMELQDNKCAICKQELNIGTQNSVAQIDHCHNEGYIRGILCFLCNTGIGKLRDSPELLRIAADYLELDKPVIETIPKYLSKEEISEARRNNAIKQHRSAEGQKALIKRSQKYRGNNGFGTKLSDQEVEEIVSRYKTGEITQHKLAEEYGVSQALISSIVLGKVRKIILERTEDVA